LRSLIRSRGGTLAALARAAGVQNSVLTRFINEEKTMTLESADRVAVALGGLKLVEDRRRAGRGRIATPKKTAGDTGE
jgi:hypothetical protein